MRTATSPAPFGSALPKGEGFYHSEFHNLRITLALFHQPWYNVRSHKTRRLFMKQFAAQFYFGYYYFFKVKK